MLRNSESRLIECREKLEESNRLLQESTARGFSTMALVQQSDGVIDGLRNEVLGLTSFPSSRSRGDHRVKPTSLLTII